MIAFPIPSPDGVAPVVSIVLALAAAAGFIAILVQAVRYWRNSRDDNDGDDK